MAVVRHDVCNPSDQRGHPSPAYADRGSRHPLSAGRMCAIGVECAAKQGFRPIFDHERTVKTRNAQLVQTPGNKMRTEAVKMIDKLSEPDSILCLTSWRRR